MTKLSKTQFWLAAIWLTTMIALFMTENPEWL